MGIREERQLELANKWMDSGKRGVIFACPRFGKIRTAIIILNKLEYKRVLVAYPDRKIRASWENEFEEMKYDSSTITYTTHISLKKHVKEQWDLVIADECHLLSNAQIETCKEIRPNTPILGLSGTLSSWSEKVLKMELNLPVVGIYSIEQAIAEGVITDYQITIVRVALDNTVKQRYKNVFLTEKAMFERYGWIIDKLTNQGRDAMFPRLGRMRIIQHSLAKQKKTIQLLEQFKDSRVLVFCGLTEIADNLGIPSYHSKSSEKAIFEDFLSGNGNHMAVVKIGNTGLTYSPLHKVIINYFDSNAQNLAQKLMRATSLEFDNPDKKADIWICCTTEETEKKWLLHALEFFEKSKIKWI